jgi:hypothetical protein
MARKKSPANCPPTASRRDFLRLAAGVPPPAALGATAPKPNVIVILVDDMGFSDIGCYGGEIPTPDIDKLAKNGVRFTQMYNAARCSPSRASLLTGLYPHQAGMGYLDSLKLPNSRGTQGRLNDESATIAEVVLPPDTSPPWRANGIWGNCTARRPPNAASTEVSVRQPAASITPANTTAIKRSCSSTAKASR